MAHGGQPKSILQQLLEENSADYSPEPELQPVNPEETEEPEERADKEDNEPEEDEEVSFKPKTEDLDTDTPNILTEVMSGTNSINPQFKIEPFSGLNFENAENWLKRFQALARLQGWTEAQQLEAFRLCLTGPAEVWYEALPTTEPDGDEKPHRKDLTAAFAAFQEKWVNTSSWLKESQLHQRRQGPTETVEVYAATMRQKMAQLKKSESEMLALFVHGLREEIKQQVILRDPKDLDDAEYAAKLCESVTAIKKAEPTVAAIDSVVTKALKTMTKQIQAQGDQIAAIATHKKQAEDRQS